MPVSIQRHVVINCGGKTEWRVKPKLILKIDGVEFVKLPASAEGFTKIVAEGIVDNAGRNPTLAQCQGIQDLVSLRNRKQAEELADAAKPSCSLFEEPAAPPQKKRPRRSKAALRELRDSPGVLDVTVPGFEGADPMNIKIVRPVRPGDDLCVPLEENVLDHIIGYIRSAGLTEDTLANKRCYKAHDAPKGVWKAGDRGFVVKQPGRRMHRVKSISDAMSFIEANQENVLPISAEPSSEPVPLQDVPIAQVVDEGEESMSNAGSDKLPS